MSRRRRKIKKILNFLDNREDKEYSLSIYTDIKKFKFCSENILLLGLLKDYPREEDYENKTRYGGELFKFCKDNIKYTVNPSVADIFILPYKFKNIEDNGYKDMVKLSKQYNKKLLCFHNDDDDKTYNLDNNVILYRTSFYKSKQLENEKAMTVLVVDHFKNNYCQDLSISFCGTIFNKGMRKRVLDILTNSDIKTDFILRTDKGNDWNTGQDINKRKREFFENIENNLMVFCNRGYGNFSYRFFETLMMGRIPLLIDSDCGFPFDDEININDIALVINEKDIEDDQYLIDRIKEYYEKNKDNIIEIQKGCRQIWEQYYSSFGFIKTMIKKYGNQGRTIYYGKDITDDKQKTAIVVSSTSKFKYIWHTFLYRLRKYWPDCPYQVYFTSDGDCEYLVDKYNINVFQQKSDLGFLEGYRYVCRKISHKYKYFILLQDDFLIEKDVNQNILNKYEDIMEENNNLGFIRIMPCPGPKGERKKFGDIELGRINKNEEYSFSYQISLWKLDYFIRITNPPIPSWDDFNMSRKMRVDKNPEELWGFIRPFKEWNAVYESPIPYRPTAILKGKLLDWAKPLLIEDIKFEGQAGQDKFVVNMTNFKTNGTFLEIGADHPKHINNTYYLEKALGWKGLMIEIRQDRYQLLKNERSKSTPIIADATTIDYKQLFQKYKMPKNIDYLQLDLEATNGSTLRALQKLDRDIMDEYKFATVTFEHDIWTGNKYELRRISREIFHKRGYFLIIPDIHNNKPEYVFEDWYIHPDLIDIELAKKIKQINNKFYVNNKLTDKSIGYKDIIYNKTDSLEEDLIKRFKSCFSNITNDIKRIKLDIGLSGDACHSKKWLEKEKDLMVFGFEPHKECIKTLKNKFSSIKNFNLLPIALDNNFTKEKTFYLTTGYRGCSSLLKPKDKLIKAISGRIEETTVVTSNLKLFFDFFPWDKIEYIDYIKIDAQGKDLDILKSAGEYLKNKVVYVTAEAEYINYHNGNNNTFKNLCDYMKMQNFISINHPNTKDPTFLNLKFKAIKDNIYIYQNT